MNEMLTQMEAFSGIFIASTNLMEGMDKASLRRFDLKIKFDYLHDDQSWSLFKRYCKVLKVGLPQVSHRRLLENLNCLTPGDFAAVSRRHRFHPIGSAMGLVEAIIAECDVKQPPVREIGFVRH